MRRKNTEDASLPLFPGWKTEPEQKKETAQHAAPQAHYDFTDLFKRLAGSAFRSRFHLRAADLKYIDEKGIDTIQRHARDMIAKRLAPAEIANDGRQTPMCGHPVFIAQHATGCCCRGCLSKWHHIQPGHILTAAEQDYVVNVIMAWIEREMNRAAR